MAHYVFMVLASPKDGSEEAWNAWHQGQHVHDVLDIEGMLSARRLRAAEVQQDGSGTKWKFATLYEVETDDPGKIFDELAQRMGTERMQMTAYSDPSKTVSQLWIPVSEHQSK